MLSQLCYQLVSIAHLTPHTSHLTHRLNISHVSHVSHVSHTSHISHVLPLPPPATVTVAKQPLSEPEEHRLRRERPVQKKAERVTQQGHLQKRRREREKEREGECVCVCVYCTSCVCVCSCGQYLRRISPDSPYSSPPNNPCKYKNHVVVVCTF